MRCLSDRGRRAMVKPNFIPSLLCVWYRTYLFVSTAQQNKNPPLVHLLFSSLQVLPFNALVLPHCDKTSLNQCPADLTVQPTPLGGKGMAGLHTIHHSGTENLLRFHPNEPKTSNLSIILSIRALNNVPSFPEQAPAFDKFPPCMLPSHGPYFDSFTPYLQ